MTKASLSLKNNIHEFAILSPHISTANILGIKSSSKQILADEKDLCHLSSNHFDSRTAVYSIVLDASVYTEM